jgi:hypothetical protein
MSEKSFKFDKFVEDIEKRQQKAKESSNVTQAVVEEDQLRRLRAERYHERWQNRIIWEK